MFLCLAKVNVDQLKKRAERFGMNVSSVSQKVTTSFNLGCNFSHVYIFFFYSCTFESYVWGFYFQIEEDEKLKKRKERFGVTAAAGVAVSADVEVNLRSLQMLVSFVKQ